MSSVGPVSFSLGSSSSRVSTATNPKFKKNFVRGKYENNVQFFLYTLAYTLSVHSLAFMYDIGEETTELHLIQYFLAYVFVGIPLYCMQMFLGQYTQMSVVNLKHMVPCGHGIIYTTMLAVFLYTVKWGLLFGDFCLYFLLAWQKNLPWMLCYDKHETNMWGKCFSGVTGNDMMVGNETLSNQTYTSAYLYYVGMFLKVTPPETDYFTFDLPALHRAIAAMTGWAVIFLFSAIICVKWPKILFVLVFQFYILVFLLTMGTISTTGGMIGFRNFFKSSWKNIGSFLGWARSVNIVVRQLALAQSFVILNASRLKTKSGNFGILTVGFCAISFVSNLFCVSFFHTCIGMLARRGRWKFDGDIQYGIKHDHGRLFALIPQSLGYLTVPQIWSLQYFVCVISIIVANEVTRIHTLHSSIAETFPSIKKYQNYMILVYCCCSCIIGINCLGESNFIITDGFEEWTLSILEIVNVTVLSILVFWIYGVRRLGDDICFTSGVQPTKFWQITWYLMPFVTLFCAYQEYSFHINRLIATKSIASIFWYNVVFIVCISPIPIFVFVEIFKHMRSRNLTGLFRPTYMWGPPDPEERHRRLSFNPRKETKYQSNTIVCNHKCLLNSKVFKNLIEPEARVTDNYLQQLKTKH